MSRPRQGCALAVGLLLSLAAARGQIPPSAQNPANSLSGQFVVSSAGEASPSQTLTPNVETNVVRLNTALLAVAAERFKVSVREQLGIPADADWSGKIYLRVHPARSLDETVTIAANPFLNHWNYEVDLPDILWKTRYARAFSGVLLLELANRSAAPGGHSAELPPWLVDGLAQQVLALAGDTAVLSAPVKKDNPQNTRDGLLISRLNQSERGIDTLARTRQRLQLGPVLTFDELSWPSDAQMDGADGGAYFASAQYFLHELLALPDGREKMRAMLADLPGHFNWQTAFFQAFGADFKRPLDVEKWWSLRVVNFAARAPGPRFTTDVSMVRLQQLVSVPVEYRDASNALPAHAEISLQTAVRSLEPDQRDEALRLKVRDLALVELRLAPPFGNLADGYRLALEDFLGDLRRPAHPSLTNKHGAAINPRASIAKTLKRLDILDRQRRDAESRSVIPLPGNH